MAAEQGRIADRRATVYSPLPGESAATKKRSNIAAEILDVILEQLDWRDTQRTAIALQRAIPCADFSPVYLFRHLIIKEGQQLKALFTRLSSKFADAEEMTQAVRTFALEDWHPDDYLAANIVAALSNVERLNLVIGPKWSPEAAEQLITRPLRKLTSLNLRFNLANRTRNYYQFHAGLYFDTFIEALSKWPEIKSFKSMSFVQDPPPTYPVPVELLWDHCFLVERKLTKVRREVTFAQPIVIFRSFCLATFAASPIAIHLASLRLRLPNKSIITALTSPQTSTTVLPSDLNTLFLPSLKLLDISLTYVEIGRTLKPLLARHRNLEHLIMDGLNIVPAHLIGDADFIRPLFRDIGRAIAAISLTRIADATKSWKALKQRQQDLQSAAQARGLGRMSSQKKSTKAGTIPAAWNIEERLAEYDTLPEKLIILPHASNLRSFCFGECTLSTEERQLWQSGYDQGWAAGQTAVKEALVDKLGQLRRSLAKDESVTLMRHISDRPLTENTDYKTPWDNLCLAHGLVECTSDIASEISLQIAEASCVFCSTPDCNFIGGVAWSDVPSTDQTALMLDDIDDKSWRRPASEHSIGCGHLVARKIWPDS